jgi:hypothetical protein
MNTDEISLIVSSDPTQGAFNRSADGSYFEIRLDDGGIQIPKKATSCFLTVEEATVWWTVSNITTANNVLRISGPSAVETVSNHNLGFPSSALISVVGGPLLRITGTGLPTGVFQVGDYIRINATGQEYYVSVINSNTSSLFECQTTNATTLSPNAGDFERQRGGGGVQQYIVTLPPGLYDLTLLNNEVARQLENAGASSATEPIISFSANTASQRVQIRFPFPSSALDLTGSDTPRDILGFVSNTYGNNPSAPFTETAQNVASFNQINYFLLHCDLTSLGIRFNNQYSQVVSQILINKPPGSQILYTPFNPARISVPELIGATRTSIRVYLTDDQNRRIDTNGEYYSARFKIQWYY